MTILIINCHWDNRGDEAAIRAMIDELLLVYPTSEIIVQRAIGRFKSFPYKDVSVLPPFPVGGRKRSMFERLAILTNGRIALTKGAIEFYKALKKADIVIHAPGGPSIGDIYLKQEERKLLRLLAVRKSRVPYVFYAPSMGPFKNKKRNSMRKKVLEGASLICLREAVSFEYVKEFIPELCPIVTLDSAFQHTFSDSLYEQELRDDIELDSFMKKGKKVIGITITDLQWNILYRGNDSLVSIINESFNAFINELLRQGYCVLFIPQLFGDDNDYDYMKTFVKDTNAFIMDTSHDCYFQQFIISKMFAVVGMRYHSNIFSAKMGTPFVSISYEQKMAGFMNKAGLSEYCININDLNYNRLLERFQLLSSRYNEYKDYLSSNKESWINESHRTTELVVDLIESLKSEVRG